MKSGNVRYLRRKNLGNYEHEELEVSTVVQEGEDAQVITEDLIDFVLGNLRLPTLEKVQQKTPGKKVEAPKKEIETNGEPTSPEKKPLVADGTTTPKEEEKTPAPKEEKKEEKKEESKKEEPKKETKRRIKKVTTSVYNREDEAHKALIGAFLDKEYKTWRTKNELPKASKASKTLNGSEFLNAEGEILDAFKVEFRKHMDGKAE